MSSVHSENLAEQVAQLDQFFAEYNSQAMQISGSEQKSSLEMLKLSCDQLQSKYPVSNPTSPGKNKNAVESICSTYDKMSETQALDLLKKKILKDTTHCHLWMFIFNILMDDNKASVAVWEDQKGMFRIKDPAKLAEMWGEKRNRTNMTYEKLSRSLRHYYEKKILRKVPKRKYTYKFHCREILKSYEVQPFYRRNSTGASHRKNMASSSGQSSPFTPVTPSPSYHDASRTHFNFPQPNHMAPSWSSTPETAHIPHMSHPAGNIYQPQPQQQCTSINQQDQSMIWTVHNQEHQFAYRQVPQPMTHYSMSQPPTTPGGDNRSLYREQPTISTDLHVDIPQFSNNYSMNNAPQINTEPLYQYSTSSSLTSSVSAPKSQRSSAPWLTLNIAPQASLGFEATQPSYGTQNGCSVKYSRSDSYCSYTSADNPSPESFLESDLTFNNIMESLTMVAF